MQKNKILIITDSLGLPRLTPEKLIASECWTHRISNEVGNADVYLYSRGGLDSDTVVCDIKKNLGGYTPDIIIIQIGIVDCAPRALTKNELTFIARIPFVNSLIHSIIKRFRKRIVVARRISYVPEDKFARNLERLKNYFSNASIYAVQIAPASEEYSVNSPGIKESVEKYNNIISNTFDVIKPYNGNSPNAFLMSDQHHLNKLGHDLVFTSVIRHLGLK
jgi:hypothetical protein